jgi:hypothetical protein
MGSNKPKPVIIIDNFNKPYRAEVIKEQIKHLYKDITILKPHQVKPEHLLTHTIIKPDDTNPSK